MDGSPPGSLVPRILQARTLEWVAISFSNAWKGKVKVKSLSCVQLFATPWTAAYQAPPSMGFSRQEYWSGVPLPTPWGRSIVTNSERVFIFFFWIYLKYTSYLVIFFDCRLGFPSPFHWHYSYLRVFVLHVGLDSNLSLCKSPRYCISFTKEPIKIKSSSQ